MRLPSLPLVLTIATLFIAGCMNQFEQSQPLELASGTSGSSLTSGTTTTITDCMDFEEFATGATPATVTTAICDVSIYGDLPSVPGVNRAMIFDSENPTGNDPDLAVNQGKILILSEDGDASDPDDANEPGSTLSMDFSACGPVTIESVVVIDVEEAQNETKDAKIIIYDAAKQVLKTVDIPNIGDGQKMTIAVNQAGAYSMDVILDGSGAIDDLCFSKEVTTGGGCTYTIGYWKTHSDDGKGKQADEVGPLLPLWLGTAGGTKSVHVTSSSQASGLLDQKHCGPGNGIGKLEAQLLGAKLNIANGADGSAVSAAIAAADAFLANYDCGDWSSLSSSDQADVLSWHNMLDVYNNGNIGPGHCD